MEINKKLISFATEAQFDAYLANNSIDPRSIVFIEDKKRIWTHGVFFDTSWDYMGDKPDTFTPSAHTHNYLSDSPQDGKIYGRKDSSWTEVGSDVYDWTWLRDIDPPSGTCTQQQYDELLAAAQTGKIFPQAASVYTEFLPPESGFEGYGIILSMISVYAYLYSTSWIIYPDLSVWIVNNYAQKNSDITKAEIEAKLTGNITSHTHSYVALSGNQTVSGTKTFSSIPVLPGSNPTTNNQAVRKKYVDDVLANKFQVVASLPTSPVTGVFYFVKE